MFIEMDLVMVVSNAMREANNAALRGGDHVSIADTVANAVTIALSAHGVTIAAPEAPPAEEAGASVLSASEVVERKLEADDALAAN